ncbi:MAG TPA: sulfur carrier protein ThiS [Acidimicrobiales bacterium]|nr:sulfur carrier protein ThiS [Acidimicrobiales bacterium]
MSGDGTVTELRIEVNGRRCTVSAGTTVAAVVAQWCDSPDGIAVARNGEVVPRSAWPTTDLDHDDHVEIVTAAAGG